MDRLTKNISDKQTYCGYEVKDCKYQQLYDFEEYNELEDYVDCDLTLAIDKLGKLEDLEEELGCPVEVVFKALKEGIYHNGKFEHPVLILDEDSFKKNNLSLLVVGTIVYLKEYKKNWWLREDKSE